jgi:hypothetical protein
MDQLAGFVIRNCDPCTRDPSARGVSNGAKDSAAVNLRRSRKSGNQEKTEVRQAENKVVDSAKHKPPFGADAGRFLGPTGALHELIY